MHKPSRSNLTTAIVDDALRNTRTLVIESRQHHQCPDILVMLGDFGCNSLCVADVNDDDSVGSSDLLIMLTVFGTECPE